MKVKASDLARIAWNADCTSARIKMVPNESQQVIDRKANGKQDEGTYRLNIVEVEVYGRTVYVVTTCGTTGKGATRHHKFATVLEATEYALTWLDYRFKVAEQEKVA